jgi:hypothetical protein
MEIASRSGLHAFAIAFVAFADLAAARALLRADEARVYFAGRAIELHCAFREATGLPCPTCGLSRSVVMSLHGEFARAWRLAPAGPVAVIGIALFAVAMLILAIMQARGESSLAASARFWIRRAALAYSAALTAVWAAGWLIAFAGAIGAR